MNWAYVIIFEEVEKFYLLSRRGRWLEESFHKIRKYKLTVIACKMNFFCRGGEIVLLSSGEIFLIAVGGVMCSSNKSYSISFLENLIWSIINLPDILLHVRKFMKIYSCRPFIFSFIIKKIRTLVTNWNDIEGHNLWYQ